MLLISFSSLKAQNNVSSAGGDAIGASGSSSFTIGQVFYDYKSDIGGSMSEGLQQSFVPFVTNNTSGQALDFDGNNDRITIPYNASLNFTTELSIEAWIFPQATSYSRIVTKYSGGGNNPGEFVFDTYDGSVPTYLANGKGLRFAFTGVNGGGVTSPNVLTLNTWNHVVGTFNNGVVKIYVNGIEVNSGSTGFTSIPATFLDFTIGEDNTIGQAEFFNGKMDEISIWNKALSETEVVNNLNTCNFTGLEANLAAHYNFNQGIADSNNSGVTTLVDYSPNNNDGTLVGFALNGTSSNWVLSGRICENNITYYQDFDEDGFGNPTVTIVASEQPTGYVLDNTDCDDTEETIYPGAPEICYDGILQNCNGTLTDGCPPVLVNMISAYCGVTLPYILSTVTAENPNLPVGTSETGYRFEITNLTTSEVRELDRPIRNFKLTMTDIYEYNTTYQVRVAIRVNAEWQPYGAVCMMNTPSIPTTQIVGGQCGTTLPLLFSSVNCNTVNSASQYRFRVVNAANTSEVQTIEGTNRFRLTDLTLFPVQYNTTYNVSVQVRVVIDGAEVWSNYGSVCTITTPSFPTTQVTLSQCELMATSYTQSVSLDIFSGTSIYRIRLTNLAYTQTIDRTSPNFSLSMFTGLQPATTYTVAISIQLNGVFGPYGKNCSITTPGALTRPVRANDTKEFNVIAFPNPFTNSFALDVKTSSATDVNVSVYDMTGRLLEVRTAKAEDLIDFNLGSQFPTGIYNIVVTQESQVKTVRVIKR